ncbi:MAG: hypothetical protein ACI9VT_002230, partial [Psychroserpens sp.]
RSFISPLKVAYRQLVKIIPSSQLITNNHI